MGSFVDSRGRNLADLVGVKSIYTADYTDVVANTGVTLSQISLDLIALEAYAASNTVVQAQIAKQASDLANTNVAITGLDTRLTTAEGDIVTNAGDIATNAAQIAQAFTDIQATNTAIRGYVDAEVASLVDGAPALLDTLNELAAAIGDDDNFAATVTTNLGQKLGSTATVELTGDALASATAFSANAVSLAVALSTTGVTAGTYGNTSTLPSFTVDAKGRISSVSSVAIGGLDNVVYDDVTDILTLTTSAGNVFTADFSDFQSQIDTTSADLAANAAVLAQAVLDLDAQELKQAADLANTNASVATVDARVATQEAKQAADLANTNVYIDSVESQLAAQTATLQTNIDNLEDKHDLALANTNLRIDSADSLIVQAFADIQATNTAVRGYVDQEVAALVDAAPAALDTLNELAAAMGDDANFATTIATNLGQKLGDSATVELTGDATAPATAFSANAVSLAVTLSNSGVVAGVYGNTTSVPVVTVDAKGRVTDVAAASLATVSGLSYEGSNNTITLTTHTGVFEATIDDLEEVSDALAKLANTNAYIAQVEADILTLEGTVESNLANTNAKMLNIESNLLATNTAIRALIPNSIAYKSFVFTATAGQTVFTGNDDSGATFAWDSADVSAVYLNGARLTPGIDWFYTDSSTLTLDDATAADDIVTVETHSVANYVEVNGQLESNSHSTLPAGTSANVDEFATGDYATVKYLVQVTAGANVQASEVLLVQNGTDVMLTEYANVTTGGDLASITASIVGGNVRLEVTPNTIADVKILRLAATV